MKNIVLFASGSGSNVENIANYFDKDQGVQVLAVFTNNRMAKVLDRCKRLNISSICFNKTAFYKDDLILGTLKGINPDLIVLAGFLWKVPQKIIAAFPNKIINLHPALLPLYGGKGMYGSFVHQAVKENKDTETGITIHFVNKEYDEGAILFQARTQVFPEDTVETIAHRVHQLEYEHFPKVIAQLLEKH